MDNILFSIVIPTYNRADKIGRAIHSVLDQNFTNYELIIVDDGSTDNTKEVVNSFQDERVNYYLIQNAERGAARNFGAKKGVGKYLTFLDSDDEIDKTHLKIASEKTKSFPSVFCLSYRIIDQSGRILKEQAYHNKDAKDLIKGNFLSCNGVFIRREDFLQNCFSEDRALSGFEDWELWLRIASKYQIDLHNEITSSIINHDARSVLKVNIKALIERANLLLISAKNNHEIKRKFQGKLHVLEGSVYTYVALHLAIDGRNKKQALKFLCKGLISNPAEILKRRFLAIIKKMILS